MRRPGKPTATINTAMREAFLKADVSTTNPKLLIRVAKAARDGRGAIKRFRLWNKTFS